MEYRFTSGAVMVCSTCPSLCQSRTQIVLPTPCPVGGLLAIGEAPGADEDAKGEGFVGRAGKTLDMLLAAHGRARGGYGRANIVRCRPEGNRKPTALEAATCLPRLAEFIQECRPGVALLVGGTPTAAFLGAGSLYRRIQESRQSIFTDLRLGHPALSCIGCRGLLAVPMPHTSPLAFNRNAPDGRKWSVIAGEQIALAVESLRDGQA